MSRFLQQVFSHKGLEGVELQELDIVSQAIGFLYGIIGMRFGVLVGQKLLTLQWANFFQELGFNSPLKFLQF
jgi:hypothetical protein